VLYIYIYSYNIILYRYVLLFVTLISIRLFNYIYYSPRTQSFRCALVVCKQKCIFYGSPPYGVHYILYYCYYFIITNTYIIICMYIVCIYIRTYTNSDLAAAYRLHYIAGRRYYNIYSRFVDV